MSRARAADAQNPAARPVTPSRAGAPVAFGVFPSLRFGPGWGTYQSATNPSATTSARGIQFDALVNGIVTLADDHVSLGLAAGYTTQSLSPPEATPGFDLAPSLDITAIPILATFGFSVVPRLALQVYGGVLVAELTFDSDRVVQPGATLGWRAGAGLNWVLVNYPGVSMGLGVDAFYTHVSAGGVEFAPLSVTLNWSVAWSADGLTPSRGVAAVRHRTSREEPL